MRPGAATMVVIRGRRSLHFLEFPTLPWQNASGIGVSRLALRGVLEPVRSGRCRIFTQQLASRACRKRQRDVQIPAGSPTVSKQQSGNSWLPSKAGLEAEQTPQMRT